MAPVDLAVYTIQRPNNASSATTTIRRAIVGFLGGNSRGWGEGRGRHCGLRILRQSPRSLQPVPCLRIALFEAIFVGDAPVRAELAQPLALRFFHRPVLHCEL